MPKKGNKIHSATDLQIKTELSDNKGVRFFVLLILAYSWRIFWKVTGFISEFELSLHCNDILGIFTLPTLLPNYGVI